jgi:hypothetical protein
VIRFVLLALCACTATQSARTLAPRSTEVSVGVGRMSFESDFDNGQWTGHAMVRRGIVDGFDLGVHLEHTTGGAGVGAIAIDPKLRLAHGGRTTLAAGAPLGVLWSEDTELYLTGVMALPSLYLSVELSPRVELVTNARYMLVRARRMESSPYVTEHGVGGTLGLRFTDEERSWAMQPEFGFTRAVDTTHVTVGLTISVGR